MSVFTSPVPVISLETKAQGTQSKPGEADSGSAETDTATASALTCPPGPSLLHPSGGLKVPSASPKLSSSLSVPSPAGVFPLPNSQQVASGSATGNPRNKVALAKGYSMMDWLRLTKSRKDLSGVGGPRVNGKIREVSRKELKRHRRRQDAWLAINGLVFNVTEYIPFHPGGDEIMKGAGKDATDQFNEVHRWVNYESMLAACLVGKLVEGDELLPSSTPDLPPPVVPAIPTKPAVPTSDHIQTADKIVINIYTKRKHLTRDHVTLDCRGGVLRVLVHLGDDLGYVQHYQLLGEVREEALAVKVAGRTGKVEVAMEKKTPGRWQGVGRPREEHNWFGRIEESMLTYRDWRVTSVSEAPHDTRLIVAEPPAGTVMSVPPGHHVKLLDQVRGMTVTRPYTPVTPLTADGASSPSGSLHFLIKIYQDGFLTSAIDKYQPGDKMRVSDHMGEFSLSQLSEVGRVVLLAAGTGVTPIVSLLPVLPPVPTDLLYFNKTRQDIIWEKEIAAFQQEHSWLKVTNILSQDPGHDGPQGRIRKGLLNELINDVTSQGKKLACVCGGTEFTHSADRFLREDLEFKEEEIHLFVG